MSAARKTAQTVDEQGQNIAAGVAANYARRIHWADRDDLKQQAMIAVLEVRQGVIGDDEHPDEPTRNKFGAYAWAAASRQLSRYLGRQGSPVSAPDKRVVEMREITRVSATTQAEQLLYSAPHSYDPGAPDQRMVEVDLIRQLVTRLRMRAPQDAVTTAALFVLFRGLRPREAAEEFGVDPRKVSKRGTWMIGLVKKDAVLTELARELAVVRGWRF